MKFNARLHRYCRLPQIWDWLRLGWMPLPTLDGSHHGHWSVHCVWICDCKPPALK